MRRIRTQFVLICLTVLTLTGVRLTVAEEESTTYRLTSKREAGSVDLVEKTFDAAGTLLLEIDPATHVSVATPAREQKNQEKEGKAEKAPKEGKNPDADEQKPLIQKIPMKVTSRQKYEEMLIKPGNPVKGEDAQATLGAWYFLENETEIKIENSAVKPALDLNQPLIGVDVSNTQIHFFRPEGFLTRDELDVVNVQGNTLLVDAILPNRSVRVGESWKQSPDVMGMLLQMDLVFNLEVETKLAEVKKGIAILETSGWIEGSYEGNTSKINVTGKAYFDLNRSRIVWFGLVIQEKRTAGFVSPGMDVTARVQYQITPQTDSKNLTEDVVSKISFDEAQYGLLLYQDPGKVWKFVLTPNWEPMNQNEYQTNFRLLREGELVAQCSVTKLPADRMALNLKPEDFANQVREMLGDRFDSILDVKTMKHDDGTEIYRVDVAAKYEGLALRMIYYLITKKGTESKQCTAVFTVEDQLMEKFGEANEQMIQSFSWME